MRITIVLVIGCGSAQQPAPQEAAATEPVPARAVTPRPVVESDFPLLCTTTKDSRFGLSACFLGVDQCEHFRELRNDSSPCREYAAGACFAQTLSTTGERGPVCFPSIAACEEMLANERAHPGPDVSDLSEQCGIYRMRQR